MDLVSNDVRTLDFEQKIQRLFNDFQGHFAIFEVLHSVQKLILCLF